MLNYLCSDVDLLFEKLIYHVLLNISVKCREQILSVC